MDDIIIISNLNDFAFCPASIYFHNLLGDQKSITYQSNDQIKGTAAHTTIDQGTYSTRNDVLTSLEVFSSKYGIAGKIDIYYGDDRTLVERKRKIKSIYDGYVFQLYGQYFGMTEAGYQIDKMFLYSIDDNKKYQVLLPNDDAQMFLKFEQLITSIKNFDLTSFVQTNREKCEHCIYEPACDRSLLC